MWGAWPGFPGCAPLWRVGGCLFLLECDVVAARLSELHGAIEGLARPMERRLCKVGAFIRSLDSEDAEWLSGALDDPSESSAGLRRTLRAAGFEVARSSLSAHRRGECCCYGVA